MAPVYGGEGEFYTLIYVPDGGQFKWGEAENDWRQQAKQQPQAGGPNF